MHGQLFLLTDCPKQMTAITSPHKPGLNPFTSQAISKNVEIILSASQMQTILAGDVYGKTLGLDENGIAGMCFWILNQPVYRINCPCM